MIYVEYDSNNSGGSFWLSDEDWVGLEDSGWEVDWVRDQKGPLREGDRFLGALATSAKRYGLSLDAAIAEWEAVTGESADDLGCECCGPPHMFSVLSDDGGYVSGYSPDYSEYGDEYDA